MEIYRRIVGIGQVGVGAAFLGLGLVGVLRSLATPATAALPDPGVTLREGPRPELSHRVERLRVRLRRAPDDPELQLQLGYACVARAVLTAGQEYSDAFPSAMRDGSFSALHFETWRRGWFCRDRDGDLRRALHLGRRVLAVAPPASPPAPGSAGDRRGRLRLVALQLVALVRRQQFRDAAAIPFLREVVALAPGNRLAWLQLSEAYGSVGDRAGFRAARRRAIDGPGSF